MSGPNFLDWFFLKIYDFLTGAFTLGSPGSWLKTLLVIVIVLLVIVGVFFFGVIVYSVTRLKERDKMNKDKYYQDIRHAETAHKAESDNKKWDAILKHVKSDNSGDWRIAILEADNLLDDLTKKLGLVGDDLGERLKNASRNHFQSLDNAWEAHKVRNKIAHEGLSFDLTYREVKKTIENYETVFREFKVI